MPPDDRDDGRELSSPGYSTIHLAGGVWLVEVRRATDMLVMRVRVEGLQVSGNQAVAGSETGRLVVEIPAQHALEQALLSPPEPPKAPPPPETGSAAGSSSPPPPPGRRATARSWGPLRGSATPVSMIAAPAGLAQRHRLTQSRHVAEVG